MNQVNFDLIVSNTINSIKFLLQTKGTEYANSEDRLANFKRGAELTGCTPLQVAFIYASKHYDAIASYVKNPGSPRTEQIEGRLDDLINYCIFIKALATEAPRAQAAVIDSRDYLDEAQAQSIKSWGSTQPWPNIQEEFK